MSPGERTLRETFDRMQRRALLVGGAAGVAVAVGGVLDPAQFFRSYLLSYLFWLAFPLGALAIVQLHHMTGGSWGFAIRRLLEGSMRTLPWMALLFVPIVLGAHQLYEWTHADVVAADPILARKSAYLNLPFWVVRAAVYFAIWISIAVVQNRLSNRQDKLGDPLLVRRMRAIAGPAMGLYALTMTFAAFDWAMSLEPHWYSTIYGVIFIVGQALTTLAFAVVASAWLGKRQPFARWIAPGHFHDLGKLMFAFVLLWAYVNYSQYLITWSGNLPEETPWYLHRATGGWQALAAFLIVFHFSAPFLVLLSRGIKRSPGKLAAVALGLIAMRYADLFWLIVPAFRHDGLGVHWLDLATPVAMGGLWFALFLRQLKGRPLISLQDAHLEAALESPVHP
jgi:hypothetical protein